MVGGVLLDRALQRPVQLSEDKTRADIANQTFEEKVVRPILRLARDDPGFGREIREYFVANHIYPWRHKADSRGPNYQVQLEFPFRLAPHKGSFIRLDNHGHARPAVPQWTPIGTRVPRAA
jgi:hypothetical protein